MTSNLISEGLSDNSSKIEARNILISLLENCDDLKARIAALKAIAQYEIRTKEIYEIIENIAISDESPLVRSEAVGIIIDYFIEDGIHALRYLYEKEKSPLVIKKFRNELKLRNCDISNSLYDEFIRKYANLYSIIPKEAEFLIDLECIIGNEIMGSFKPLIEDYHIFKLDLAGLNLKLIPSSIGSLLYLKNLNLWNNNLCDLPKSFENLSNLEDLYLDWNNFTKIPEIDWSKLKSLKKLSLTNNPNLRIDHFLKNRSFIQNLSKKYIKEGVHHSEALALVCLEIITGQKIEKVHDNQSLNRLYACNYKLNDSGHIIGLYLYGYYGFQIKRIPNEIFSLKYLKELIIRDQQVDYLPDIINNLMYLEKLDLLGNKLTFLPESIKELKSINFLDLEGNKIKEIPRSILNSDIDLWL